MSGQMGLKCVKLYAFLRSKFVILMYRLVSKMYTLDNIRMDTNFHAVLIVLSSQPSYLGLQLQLLVKKSPLLQDLHLEALFVPVQE